MCVYALTAALAGIYTALSSLSISQNRLILSPYLTMMTSLTMYSSSHLIKLTCYILNISTLALALNLPLPHNTNPTLMLPSSYNPLDASLPVECIGIRNPPQPALTPSSCDIALDIACSYMGQTREQPRNAWRWAGGQQQQGCAMGWYIPKGSDVPTEEECKEAFGGILDRCSMDSRFNAGVRNVREMPTLWGKGTAVEEGETRWIMAPQTLTR